MSHYQWEIKVSLFKNRFILKEIGIAVGIPFGLLLLFIIIISKGDIFGSDAKYAIGLIGMLFFLTALLLLVVYKGKYAPGFIVDDMGVVNYTQKKQAKSNFIINFLVVILGLFRGDYSVAGAGVLAQSRQMVKIKWKDVRRVKFYSKQKTILIKGNFAEKIAIFCTEDNYHDVSQFVYLKAVKERNLSKRKKGN